jgi:hypothetical protein
MGRVNLNVLPLFDIEENDDDTDENDDVDEVDIDFELIDSDNEGITNVSFPRAILQFDDKSTISNYFLGISQHQKEMRKHHILDEY